MASLLPISIRHDLLSKKLQFHNLFWSWVKVLGGGTYNPNPVSIYLCLHSVLYIIHFILQRLCTFSTLGTTYTNTNSFLYQNRRKFLNYQSTCIICPLYALVLICLCVLGVDTGLFCITIQDLTSSNGLLSCRILSLSQHV